MDLEKLKGSTLDDKTFAELQSYVTGLVEQRDAARQESIAGRKGKDAKLKELNDHVAKLLEKLGVDSIEDLDSLPDAKGQAEAVRQFEAKVKKLERELGEKSKSLEDLSTKHAAERRERAIAQAVAKHAFVDPDDARTLIAARVRQEGDDLIFEGEGGKPWSIEDGAAWLAKTKAHLVRPAGAAGGGSGFKGGGQGGGQIVNPWSPKTFNVTEQMRVRRENPALADSLKAQAASAAAS